ncbi:MAG: immunoglobulin-like domain-containing protein, partial [bacterium]
VTTVTTASTTSGTTTEYVDQSPVISGIDDVTIEKNAGFAPLAGVTASDFEDGDLTSEVRYTGNVNPNAVGVYTLIYTVSDSYGNVTSVPRVVTVVLTDTQVPLLSGVGAITIYVGEEFDPLAGVQAVDTIDGEVEVVFEGVVDIWTPGTYEIAYSAEDTTGNEATATRIVTVTWGDFVFGDVETIDGSVFTTDGENLLYSAISGGFINESIAPFSYLKIVVTGAAVSAGDIGVSFNAAASSRQTIAITATSTSYEIIYVLTAPVVNGVFTIDTNGLSLDFQIEVSFAEIRDMVAPVLNLPSDEFGYPVGYDLATLQALLVAGATAVDAVDGNLTASITIDYADLDVNVVGMYDIVYSVEDAGGNVTTAIRTVTIGNMIDSGILTDPTFQNQGDAQWNEKSNNGEADITYNAGESIMNVEIISLGGWSSAAGAYYKQSSLTMETGVWYMMTFTVKTTIARQMMFRMGLALGGSPWYDDFDGISAGHTFNITTEWQTFNFYFTLDTLIGSDGSSLFGIELNLGNINYSNVGAGGITSFKDVYIYKLTTSYEAPTITQNVGADLPTKLTVGDALPDFAAYVTALDMSRQELVCTIDSSAVDMNVAGSYDVVYSATDNHDMTSSYTITFEVFTVETADTVGPVVTIKDGVPTTLDQFTNIEVNLTQLVDVVDAADGIITVTAAMVDDGGLNFNVAGIYTVTYTVYDASGNVTVFAQDVTIVDKEGPAINIANFTINFGDAFDPFVGLSVNDNVDGAIDVASVTVTGLDAFMTGGVASVEGTFEITYSVADALGNVATKIITVKVSAIIWNEAAAVSLLGTNDEGPTHSSVAYDAGEDAYLITAIDPNTDSWDHARMVWYFDAGTELVAGQTYKFAITVKATVATDLYFRIGSTLWVDPWIDNFDGGLETVAIGTEYVTYQVIFTVDKAMVNGTAKFQFMYGYLPTDAANTIYVKEFDLVGEALPEYVEVLDLIDANAFTGTAGNGITVGYDAGDAAVTISNIPVYTYDWNTGRVTFMIPNTDLEFGTDYRFAITMKALTATKVRFWIGTSLAADPWIDTFSDCKTDVNVTDAYQTYYVYFNVDKESFIVDGAFAKFEFSIGYLDDAANQLFVKDFAIEEVIPPHNLDVVLIDAFEYVDEAAFEVEWTHRYQVYPNASVNIPDDEHLTLDAEYNAMIFSLPESPNNGWTTAKVDQSLASFGATDEYKFLSFYITNNTNKTAATVWLYWSGGQNSYAITLPAIGESGWVTLDVTTSGHTVAQIIDFGLSFNNWTSSPVTESVTVYKVLLVKDVAELEYVDVVVRPNAVPVVAISDADLAALAGLTLEAGISIESLIPTLLGMISITDEEDGVITAIAGMITAAGLDLANPVMGSYMIQISTTDSKGGQSNILTIPLSIVTILNDFNGFADDVAFKANPTPVTALRAAGSSWGMANGALIKDGDNGYISISYGTGMNGLKVAINKADLIAAGATYIGVYFKTSSPLAAGTLIQNYGYTAGGANNELVRSSAISYIDEGTYLWIPVAAILDTHVVLSFQINVTSGTGTLTIDHLVIK